MVDKKKSIIAYLLNTLFLIFFIISLNLFYVDYLAAEEERTCEEAFLLCMVFEPHVGTKGLYCLAGYLWCIKYLK